jgi:hypothetical protein
MARLGAPSEIVSTAPGQSRIYHKACAHSDFLFLGSKGEL